MLLQRKAFCARGGIADAELQLHRRRDRAVAEIAARLGAVARGQRVGEEFRRQFHHVVQRLAALLVPRGIGRHRRQRHAGHRGQPLDGFGKGDAFGLHQESRRCCRACRRRSRKSCFWSLTVNDGDFSCWNGDSPFHSRPAFFNFTRRPTTSETGSRARSSSRNWGVKRMGGFRSVSEISCGPVPTDQGYRVRRR